MATTQRADGSKRLSGWRWRKRPAASIIAPGSPAWVDDGLLDVALVLTVLSGAYYFLMARRRLFATKPAAYRSGGYE